MNFIQSLEQNNIPFKTSVSCKTLSSFKIGGVVDFLIEPTAPEQLKSAINIARLHDVRYIVIGCGSNLLFSDNGFRGAIIRIRPPFSGCELISENTIRVFAGEKLSRLCTFASQHSLSGLEFAYGIPGSLGGAVFMNAGAYGGEISDVLTSAAVLTKDLNLETRSCEQMNFSYRHSELMDSGEILIHADLTLKPADKHKILEKMDDLLTARNEKQPLSLPSAGSTFKRPVGGYASSLIDECDLKGFTIGGASVSAKHAGFVVNNGNASCEDILALCSEIKRIVLEKKHIELELEIAVVPEK